MLRNIKHVVSFTLLSAFAVNVTAAPAPVTDLSNNQVNRNTTRSTSPTVVSGSNSQSTVLSNQTALQIQLQQQVDEMAIEISDLRGQLERNNYEMKQMQERQRELFIEVDRLRSNQSTPVKAAEATVNEPQGKFSTNENEQQAYQNAVDLILKQRDYDGAITAFKQFQVDYPDSTFTSNSHFWLGQLYFAKKKDQDSAKSFAAVVTDKSSVKRAESLLKLGEIAARNNNPTQAKKFYQQIVDEYPNSESAAIAQKQL